MSIGTQASAAIVKSGYSITYLYDLYKQSEQGNQSAKDKIALLIKRDADLDVVFYAFRTAAKRAQDAKRTVERLKNRNLASQDPRNGGWVKLRSTVTAKRPVRK